MSPAPFLAALSAISLPERQTCDGTHWKRTSVPRVTSWCLTVTICTSGIRSEGREYRPGVATSNLSTRSRSAVRMATSSAVHKEREGKEKDFVKLLNKG